MERIINYRDIPANQRETVLDQVQTLGFSPAYGKTKTMLRIMNQSVDGNGPQFYFIFRDEELIGYLFLIGDEKRYRAFPWQTIGNEDEQRMELCEKMVHMQIQFFEANGRLDIAEHCEERLVDYRAGLGKRAEEDCR